MRCRRRSFRGPIDADRPLTVPFIPTAACTMQAWGFFHGRALRVTRGKQITALAHDQYLSKSHSAVRNDPLMHVVG